MAVLDQFCDMKGKYIAYKSNATDGEIWYGLVRKVEPDADGEVEINGCMHNVSSITVIKVIPVKDGIIVN